MAYIRWLYKSWNIFWTFVGVLVLSVAIFAGTVFGVMQLQPVKNLVAEQLEDQFGEQFQGVVSIGRLGGLLPLNLEMEEVKIYPNKETYEPVFEVQSMVANLDIWSLLQNRLFVRSVNMESPYAVIDRESEFSLDKAFVRLTTEPGSTHSVDVENNYTVPGFQIVVPSVSVNGGNLVFRNAIDQGNRFTDSDSLQIQNLSMQMFFEYTDEQRFVDIETIRFDVPELEIDDLELFGQVYNDNRFFEVNALTVRYQNASARFNGEVDGLDILRGDVAQQMENSEFTYFVDRISITPAILKKFIPASSRYLTSDIQGSIEGSGNLDSLTFSNSELISGESFIRFFGSVQQYNNPASLSYKLNATQISLGQTEWNALLPFGNDTLQQALSTTTFEGSFRGDFDTSDVRLYASHIERGNIDISGAITWAEVPGADLRFTTDSLNIGHLVDPRIASSNLNLQGQFKSNSFNIYESEGGLSLQSDEGEIDNRRFDQLSILANWSDGFIEPDIRVSMGGAVLTTNGQLNVGGDTPQYNLRGSAQNLKIDELVQWAGLKPVTADLEYDFNLTGDALQNLHGQLSLDILRAEMPDDTLDRHQLYVDLNDPRSSQRELRFTSTAFDGNISGNFTPEAIATLGVQWKNYFVQRYHEEFAFESASPVVMDSLPSMGNQDINLSLNFKNLGLIHSYVPAFPLITSTARIHSTVNMDDRRMLFTTTISDNRIASNGFQADTMRIQATGGFRIQEKLKDFSGLQLQVSAANLNYDVLDAKNFQFSANLDHDSISINSSIKRLAEEANFILQSTGKLNENELAFTINEFNLGSDTYQWRNQAIPNIRYHDKGKLTLDNFIFESDSQFVQVDGTFSSQEDDSVRYNIQSLDLGKISQILDARIGFAGELNGAFTTTTLTTIPTIQGSVDLEGLHLNDNLFGDLSINSQYNSTFDRFDTRISASTDSAKYPEYYANNGRKGQHFEINGYVLSPQDGRFPAVDSVFAFEGEFENIDLWILPVIGPKVFAEGAGLAKANGKIWGNTNTYDYEVDFTVGTDDAAFIRPQFLDTYYYAQGGITWNRARGFQFEDIYLVDPTGGNAILSGYYDVNDFAPTDTMDISLDMNEFQFLNNAFDPTVAFFGEAFGNGVVTISGTNFDPVISTQEPVMITDFSEISIPLLEETEFNEDNRFIRFVQSFDAAGVASASDRLDIEGNNTSPAEADLSFAERFTLDLQFEAVNPMNVRLIFDPVTGDIITAQGTGRLRILLEDEQVSMFGRFDISGGRYQFVSGDIFTRRFEIEPGGSIIWEGDPANARLDVNAIYSARPDINTLSGSGTRDPENAQRVPVELVLNIGGTMYSIENDFFFRLPDTFEAQQNSTLSTQLATINRDENLKLIQATNFMLMGNFIPVSSAGDAQANLLGDNISGSAAVLNPLLSSQVINPLLSNQVNSLLNSDLSSLDVDFNLNTYNQVDLGAALRLYNDKLILRREGQITGRQSNIGDLGATYRINQTFAVTAFHRQDLTFGTLSSTEQSQQSQEINGVGLEAKVSFNTWDEFFNRLFSPFRKLFGTKEEEQNQEELTDNRQDQDPV